MSRFFNDLPELIGLDLDGMVILSIAAKFDNGDYINCLSKTPNIKKTILDLAEIIERIVPIKYELADFQSEEMKYLYESMKHASKTVIITNRSSYGLDTLWEKIPNFEKMVKEYNIDCIQVRENLLNLGQSQMKDPSIHIIETPDVKPNEAVLYPLIDYAERSGIERNKILIADDNPQFRVVAKKLGFQTFPDDVLFILDAKLESSPALP